MNPVSVVRFGSAPDAASHLRVQGSGFRVQRIACGGLLARD